MSLKYECDENDEPMFNWILKRAQERYTNWKYQCHKAYLKEWPSGMPSDFIGREDQWEFLCSHFESDEFKRLLGKQAELWGEDYASPHGVFSYRLHNRGTQNTRRGTSNYQRF